MSQIITKFIANLAVISGATGTGKIGSGAAAATSALFADGSGGTTFRNILSTDVPTLNQNTTGTAANITATSNSTLTTLSALTTAGSLAISGSQVSGGTFGAVNGSALTNLSAAALSGVLPVGVTGGSGLSIATTQLTGNVSLTSQVSGVLPIANGGTDNGSLPVTAGGVLYTDGTKFQNVGVGTSGQVLTSNGASAPTWTAAASGTVTSVGFADTSTTPIYTITNSPVTSSGTIDQTLNTQAANSVFAGPSSGSAAQPTFRALVAADIPSLSATYVTQSEVGAASGVASLDSGGKVPLSQLPATLMEFKGSWNPNTNTPTLVDGTGTTGFTYWVSAADAGPVAGLNDPSMYNFQIGDLVIYNGTAWVLVTPAAGVQSVNGAQGAVVLSMASANGFAGSYSGGTLTVSTTVAASPVVASNGTALIAGTTTGTGSTVVLATSPTLVTPALGTPSAIVLTNATGTAAGLTAGTVTTNANLTGDVTSVGNATSLVATSNGTLTTLSALTTASSLSSVGTITSGTWNGTTIAIAHGGTGQTTAAAAFNALNPMTTTGDMIYESATNVASRLPIGSSGQVLTVVGGIPAWSATAATATNGKDTFVLSSTDITNQFVTLSHTPLANSTDLLIQGAGDQLEGASYDYTVSGATIVFKNGLATGGVSALVAGDILQVQYEY